MDWLQEKILLECCEENPVVSAGKFLALLDKNEQNREDLTWDEFEPYIRILGVRTRDLYENNSFIQQDFHKIEGKILEKHEKICKILNTRKPVEACQALCRNSENLEKTLIEVQEKQKSVCEKVLKFLNEIHEKIQSFASDSQEGAFQECSLRLKKVKLKIQYLKNSMSLEIYSERSSQALKVIRDELESTYDEYNDIRRMLNERIGLYENNESIKGLLKKYVVLKQRINKKKQDILSISK